MRNAPALMLFALFDSVLQIEGAQVAIFEEHHPAAPEAFRAWCAERGHSFTEITTGRGVTALVFCDGMHGQIYVHVDANKNRKVA